jgi:ATP-dependent exoDNAse (exonuclease V) alpha subunit
MDKATNSIENLNIEGDIKLTEDQKRALEEIKYHVDNRTRLMRTIIVLEGYAGTGKTTLIKELLKSIELDEYEVALCSFTNKATKVMNTIVNSAKTNYVREAIDIKITTSTQTSKLKKYQCSTIHILFGLEPSFDDIAAEIRDGDVKYSKRNKGYNVRFNYKDSKSPLAHISLLIVDEFSILSNDLINVILTPFKYNPHMIILFIGDREQLKPIDHKIGEEIPLFKIDQKEYNVIMLDRLKTIMRAQNILTYYYKFFIDKFNDPQFFNTPNRLKCFPYSKVEEILNTSDDILKLINKDNVHEFIIITYRNVVKDAYNRMIKQHLAAKDNVNKTVRITSKDEQLTASVEDFVDGWNFDADDIVVLDNHVTIFEYGIVNGTLYFDFDMPKYILHFGEIYRLRKITEVNIDTPTFIKTLIGVDSISGYYIELLLSSADTKDVSSIALCGVERLPVVSYKEHNRLLKLAEKITNKRDKMKVLMFINKALGKLLHGYAITLYKSQGSTIPNVIVDLYDLSDIAFKGNGTMTQKNKQYFSYMYVALTRASKNVYYITS